MIKKFILTSFCATPIFCFGTVLQPWYPERGVELQGRAEYLFQGFNTVRSTDHNFSYRARDSFLDLSVLGSVEGYGAELELILSDTKAHTFYPDSLKMTGRVQLTNDSAGDDLSVIVGATAILPTSHALKDISSFHHGHFEGELHVSLGKEIVCYNWWTSRYWSLCSLGCATDEGSPWLRINFNYESNWERQYFFHLFVNSLFGFGRKPIHKDHFHGYGSVAHRSIDLGGRLSYLFENDFTISLGYAFRVYAQNFPEYANLVTLSVVYPFSL